jgi:hypothetical protein
VIQFFASASVAKSLTCISGWSGLSSDCNARASPPSVARSDAGASRPIGGGVGQSPLARHCLALRSCTSVIPLARAIALACAKPSRLT